MITIDVIRTQILKVSHSISKINGYSVEQEELVFYSLKTIIFEILKIMGCIFIFSIFGYWKEVLIAIIVICTTKPFVGGLHMPDQLSCFILSLLLIGSIIFLSTTIKLPLLAVIILLLISLFAIYEQAPIPNPQMPLNNPILIQRNRIRGLVFTIVYSLIAIILLTINLQKDIPQVITWSILFTSVLMFEKRK